MDRDALLALTKPRVRTYEITSGNFVHIRSITELERARFEALPINSKGGFSSEGFLRMRPTLIAYCLCNKDGKRTFTEADVPRIMELDAAITVPLFDACMEWCGIDRASLEDAKKNYVSTNGDSSHTSLQETAA